MNITLRRPFRPSIGAIIPTLLAASLTACYPAMGATLRLASDVSQELDVASSTPLILEFEIPDNVIEVHLTGAWVTGKQNLGTFVTMDGEERSEVLGGVSLAVDLQAPCGGSWRHRSAVIPQGTWDYDATFEWDDEGSGCESDLDGLLGAPFSATVTTFPEYQPYDQGWWEIEPALFLVAIILEFEVEYAVPETSTSWSRVKAIYN